MEGVDGAEGQYYFVPEGEGGAEFNKEIAGLETNCEQFSFRLFPSLFIKFSLPGFKLVFLCQWYFLFPLRVDFWQRRGSARVCLLQCLIVRI